MFSLVELKKKVERMESLVGWCVNNPPTFLQNSQFRLLRETKLNIYFLVWSHAIHQKWNFFIMTLERKFAFILNLANFTLNPTLWEHNMQETWKRLKVTNPNNLKASLRTRKILRRYTTNKESYFRLKKTNFCQNKDYLKNYFWFWQTYVRYSFLRSMHSLNSNPKVYLEVHFSIFRFKFLQ